LWTACGIAVGAKGLITHRAAIYPDMEDRSQGSEFVI
jgi:hypothetical protein